MKTLVESLFDDDLVSSVLPVEKAVKELDRYSLKDMSYEHVMNIIHLIEDSGEKYNAVGVKSHKTDLSKNVLMFIRKNLKTLNEVSKYGFYYMMDKDGNGEKLYSVGLLNKSAGGYYWETYNRYKYTPTKWKTFISLVDKYYAGCDFIILPELISEELIKIIKHDAF